MAGRAENPTGDNAAVRDTNRTQRLERTPQ